MTDVAIVAFSQWSVPSTRRNEPELLLPVLDDVVGQVGLTTSDMGFVCSGSSDYLAGQPFSFVAALDAVGPWPPLSESHVEMDGAWALYEAMLWLESGDADTALVYSFGKTSPSEVARTLALQLEQSARVASEVFDFPRRERHRLWYGLFAIVLSAALLLVAYDGLAALIGGQPLIGGAG